MPSDPADWLNDVTAFSDPTDWTTPDATYRVVTFGHANGETMAVWQLNPDGEWRGYAYVSFSPDENSMVGFDRWRTHVTGFSADRATAYPAWLKVYPDGNPEVVRGLTGQNWHVTYDRAAGEGYAWHTTLNPGEAVRYTVSTDGPRPLVLFRTADGVPHDTVSSVQRFVDCVHEGIPISSR